MILHVVLVAYNNAERTERRWTRDIAPALEFAQHPYVVTVVDNSAEPSTRLAEMFGEDYLWQRGDNLMYGASLNLAVTHKPSDIIVYVCTQHGRMLDRSWLRDLINPILRFDKVGMAGHLMGSNSPGGVAHSGGPGCEWVEQRYQFEDGVRQHVQGGVFAARTELMRKFPYPKEYPHLYTDHLISWEMMINGYECHDVATVKSLWRDVCHNCTGLKFLHDYAEENC